MKKILLVTVFTITSLVASQQAQATLTDIKESLYHLIKDYQELKNKTTNHKGKLVNLDKTQRALLLKIDKIDKAHLESEKEILEAISTLQETDKLRVKQIEKLTINYEVDADDEIIDNFIKANQK